MTYTDTTQQQVIRNTRGGKISRRSGTLGALAIAGLLVAGCSSGPAATGGNTDANGQTAVKFSECMRHHGVPAFPDPDPSGQLTIDGIANGSSVDTNSEAFKQAISACKDLEPAGFVGHKRTAKEQAAGLKFAQCIRDNGVKDFPDPTEDSPMVDTNRIPSAASSAGMSALRAAMQRCRGLAADAGVTGAR